tara:strand:- start:62 stop:739 length:678 start_codon:yes stop_codon:yes gene_type:complete
MREVVVDTETTGLSHKNGDRIIEVACIELINHVPTKEQLQFYCSTDKRMSEEAIKVHGISNEFLKKFPTFKDQAKDFLDFIQNDKLIIHNAEFDLGFLNNELKTSGFTEIKNEYIDTVLLARKKLNTRTANLDFLCKRFSIDLSSRALHGALLDCQLLTEVYIELLGGRQVSLELSNSKNFKKNINSAASYEKKLHKIQISNEEKEEHKNLIAQINNSLWKKVKH